ncbi:major facilitator superfamily domain-containing protein [Boeremia exigua]|uniref:major facilitator superfamily domain-containing protein n=1 Tax=Boeremia exigua TaxID=749465 RepID=UPI001E8EBD40|nr:major facilitator superfamily domain-containing protein [Boeremia exigua]KAH6620461.1 major facilitator superfamily domain-containing protein [Boeremia exigua]
MSQGTSLVNSVDDLQKQAQPQPDIERPPVELDEKTTDTPPSGPPTVSPFHPSQFPDGGKDAWLCLLGGFCCLFCSFGWINCLGVFQNYYSTHQLRDSTPSSIAWIASLEIFMMFFPGPIVGWAFDNYGPKYLLIFGTFFHVFGLMMTSLCTEYYQIILAQAICSPLGLNCIFNAATSTIPTWFLKKRGTAYGIMAAGSGLGGIIIPIMASHLIPRIGFGWTMRSIAFMLLGLLIIAILTITSRLPPRPRPLRFNVFMEPFADMRFVLLTASSFLFFMGLFIPINFIETQAIADGMSDRLAGYLLAVLNAASIFGRIIPGLVADKFGAFNMQSVCCLCAGIIVLALGLPASGNAAYITFAALYGFASGAYVSLLPSQLARISEVHQLGVRLGVTFACVSFAGLVGNPIAGAIVTKNKGKYWGLNVFSGVLLLAGASMFAFTRMYIAKWKIAAKV